MANNTATSGTDNIIQIATVAELMDGKLPKLPPQEIGGGYKMAPREEAE